MKNKHTISPVPYTFFARLQPEAWTF